MDWIYYLNHNDGNVNIKLLPIQTPIKPLIIMLTQR